MDNIDPDIDYMYYTDLPNKLEEICCPMYKSLIAKLNQQTTTLCLGISFEIKILEIA